MGSRHSRKILAEYDTGYSKEYRREEVIPSSLEVFPWRLIIVWSALGELPVLGCRLDEMTSKVSQIPGPENIKGRY